MSSQYVSPAYDRQADELINGQKERRQQWSDSHLSANLCRQLKNVLPFNVGVV